ncbi:DNA translocase FtsK [Mesoplasma syrphidae]|uniref:DNA translocase FtsK n=1 Tax=Mesoplasma syrphidae TaxID=225999 RepID=A0A2K9BZA3_9MOLU|nr:DNA translocase FtsK [Mesoplasma syrphidae]AUF83698.1 DNA translocase FtsK [Mesoplasma syrphidae]
MANSSLKRNDKVIAHHTFNDERTVAFSAIKKKYKQDSIAWVVSGLILFVFTLFSLGRITIIGQFFDDVFFNFLFGWFKYPVYLLLMLIDICIYAGIRFKFKKRFLAMILATVMLCCWLISLILTTNLAYNPIEDYHFDKIWQRNSFLAVFDTYFTEWKSHSIFEAGFYSETLDWFINPKGYFNLYSGGGIAGTLLTGTFMYLSIPVSYILISVFLFLDISWILTGDPIYLLKKPQYRKGKGLRILSLKSLNNPNKTGVRLRNLEVTKIDEGTISKEKPVLIHNGWNSLNVFDKNSDIEASIIESDLTIQLPSYHKQSKPDLFLEEIEIDDNFEKYDEDPTIANLTELDSIFEDDDLGMQGSYAKNIISNDSKKEINKPKLETKYLSDDDEILAKLKERRLAREAATPIVVDSFLTKTYEKDRLVAEPKPEVIVDEPKQINNELDAIIDLESTKIAAQESVNDFLSDTEFFDSLYTESTSTKNVEKITSSKSSSNSIEKIIEDVIKVEEPKIAKVIELPEIEDDNLEATTIEEPILNRNYKLPSSDILQQIEHDYAKERANKEIAALKTLAINETFDQFGVKAKVINTIIGPSVTKFEVQPEHGTKVNSITALENDLKLALASQNIRLEAPIQGKNLVGIEIANQTSEMVSMKEIIESIPKEKANSKLLFVLGKNVLGEPLTAELNKMPHLLVAGSTGSGKSVMINTLICSILLRAKPNEVKFLMIDPKKVELSVYTKIPHMLAPVISDMKQAANALKMIVLEMERRYELFMDEGVRNIEGYNSRVTGRRKLPFLVVIIDELADLMMTGSRKDVEESIMRITQMARAAGIHLIVATQRPSVDVITGTIKTNIPTRIAFAVTTGTDSRTILDSIGAEKLLGRGDMLFMPPGSSELIRAQGAYMSDEEIDDIVAHAIKEQTVSYENSFDKQNLASGSAATGNGEADDMFEEVKAFVIEQRKASTSLIQRKFNLGYNRAANIIDDLEANGIIGPQNGSKPREVLVEK